MFVALRLMKNYADSSVHCKSLGGSLALPESVEECQRMIQDIGIIQRIFFSLSALIHRK